MIALPRQITEAHGDGVNRATQVPHLAVRAFDAATMTRAHPRGRGVRAAPGWHLGGVNGDSDLISLWLSWDDAPGVGGRGNRLATGWGVLLADDLVDTPWDPGLHETMHAEGRAVYEETLGGRPLADLATYRCHSQVERAGP